MKDPVWNKKERTAPFDNKTGSLYDYYPGNKGWYADKIEIRDVMQPFKMTLELIGYGRGRSSVTFQWKDINSEAKFDMFVSDFTAMVIDGKVEGKPIITANWNVIKKGSNYGIQYHSTCLE